MSVFWVFLSMANPRVKKNSKRGRGWGWRERKREWGKEGNRRFKNSKKRQTNFNGSFHIHSARGKIM